MYVKYKSCYLLNIMGRHLKHIALDQGQLTVKGSSDVIKGHLFIYKSTFSLIHFPVHLVLHPLS